MPTSDFEISLTVANPNMIFFAYSLMFNGLDKKYSEGSKKDIREYTDFGRAKLMIS
jgi:hypothetical protein